jgi:hypothetical protein
MLGVCSLRLAATLTSSAVHRVRICAFGCRMQTIARGCAATSAQTVLKRTAGVPYQVNGQAFVACHRSCKNRVCSVYECTCYQA